MFNRLEALNSIREAAAELHGRMPATTYFSRHLELLFNPNIIAALTVANVTNNISSQGLPPTQANWYIQEGIPNIPAITHLKPRVINIGSGPESRKLHAINVDIVSERNPDIVADAARIDEHLPRNWATLVRASHVLEHFPPTQIPEVLSAWEKVLHPDGELHVSVPDAAVVFDEILEGFTPKGKAALPIDAPSSAVLTQIYGLGHQNPNTHPAWLHHILFNSRLLVHTLRQSGFEEVRRRSRRDDLAAFCGVDDDSQNHYTLSVTGRKTKKSPHPNHEYMTQLEFQTLVDQSRGVRGGNTPVTYIVPVRNEARNLPRLLNNLHAQPNPLNTPREYVFVINDTTDPSETIIRRYADGGLQYTITHSDPGIMKAFYAGTQVRQYEGFVGKLDADCLPEPGSLSLLEMFLANNTEVFATYSEPKPFDAARMVNRDDHIPEMRTKRMYIHGKNSLYRDNPFAQLTGTDRIIEGVKIEDMFLSFYLAYYFGLDSIRQAPGAFVGCRTIANMHDLQNQVGRVHHELQRVYEVFPPFQAIGNILQRDFLNGQLKRMRAIAERRATQNGNGSDGWTMIGSTK